MIHVGWKHTGEIEFDQNEKKIDIWNTICCSFEKETQDFFTNFSDFISIFETFECWELLRPFARSLKQAALASSFYKAL